MRGCRPGRPRFGTLPLRSGRRSRAYGPPGPRSARDAPATVGYARRGGLAVLGDHGELDRFTRPADQGGRLGPEWQVAQLVDPDRRAGSYLSFDLHRTSLKFVFARACRRRPSQGILHSRAPPADRRGRLSRRSSTCQARCCASALPVHPDCRVVGSALRPSSLSKSGEVSFSAANDATTREVATRMLIEGCSSKGSILSRPGCQAYGPSSANVGSGNVPQPARP